MARRSRAGFGSVYAGERTRTSKGREPHRDLNPARLPIPPRPRRSNRMRVARCLPEPLVGSWRNLPVRFADAPFARPPDPSPGPLRATTLAYSGVTYAAVRPPSTRNVAPFTYDDSSLARKSAAFTISRGFASRPIGRWRRRRSYAAGSSPKIRRSSGVSTGPGQSALTRTPWRANWTASSRLIDRTAPLDAV